MNKKIFPLMAAAAMMLLTACYHDKHEFTPDEAAARLCHDTIVNRVIEKK